MLSADGITRRPACKEKRIGQDCYRFAARRRAFAWLSTHFHLVDAVIETGCGDPQTPLRLFRSAFGLEAATAALATSGSLGKPTATRKEAGQLWQRRHCCAGWR